MNAKQWYQRQSLMAGSAGSSALRATFLLTAAARTTPCLFSSDSKFLCLPDFSKFDLSLSLSPFSRASSAIKARGGYTSYGGGSRSWSRSDSDEEYDEEYDSALDLSTLRSKTARLIDQDQKMVGVVPIRQAQQMAEAAELDLVIISQDADPPVLKIMDFDKHRYEQEKRKKDQLKRSIAGRMDLKELKMGYNIDVHDYAVRLKAAKKFLTEGQKVKLVVNLKGRANIFKNDAIKLMRRFQSDIGELATEEARNFSDKNMFMIMVPNKAFIQKTLESAKKPVVAEAEADTVGVEAEAETAEVEAEAEAEAETAEVEAVETEEADEMAEAEADTAEVEAEADTAEVEAVETEASEVSAGV